MTPTSSQPATTWQDRAGALLGTARRRPGTRPLIGVAFFCTVALTLGVFFVVKAATIASAGSWSDNICGRALITAAADRPASSSGSTCSGSPQPP